MDKKEFSENLKVVKLLTSSLFARKQPYVILNGMNPGVLYYTNIAHERIALYRPNMEDVLSKVILKDQKVIDALYAVMPALKESIVMIDVKAFGAGLNKHLHDVKEEYPIIKIDPGGRIISMDLSRSLKKDGTPFGDFPIGILLSDADPEFYEDILKKFSEFSDTSVRRQFKATETVGEDKITMEIIEVAGQDHDGDSAFAYPFKDGFSGVSFREYIRKRQLQPIYDVTLLMNPMARTAKALIDFADDWLTATTILPGSLWFMSRR